jgi:type III pantothenate kinase
MNLLTVDLGNSRCKLRRWIHEPASAPELGAEAEFESAPGLGEKIAAWIGEGRHPEGASVCSVADERLEDEVAGALRDVVGAALDLRPDPGLTIACREPSKVGRDRLFAARAAIEVAGGSAIVVDVGTAMTIDAVRGDRTFLGGAIAPGPALLARALNTGAARLPHVEPSPGGNALGLDTEEALRAGIAVGLRGAAHEIAARVAQEAGFQGAPVVLTGGGRGFLLAPSAFGASRVLEERDLVHLGLLAVRRPRP